MVIASIGNVSWPGLWFEVKVLVMAGVVTEVREEEVRELWIDFIVV